MWTVSTEECFSLQATATTQVDDSSHTCNRQTRLISISSHHSTALSAFYAVARMTVSISVTQPTAWLYLSVLLSTSVCVSTKHIRASGTANDSPH